MALFINEVHHSFYKRFLLLTTADIIETFIYRTGIQKARFDFTTAAGLFNSLVVMTLVLVADRLAKKMDLQGIF